MFARDLGVTPQELFMELMTERSGHPHVPSHPQWTGPLESGPPQLDLSCVPTNLCK